MFKMFDANIYPEELATYLNRRGFRLDSVSMFITDAGFCGVSTRRTKLKHDPYDEYDDTKKKRYYRRIKVFQLIDGENADLNDLYERASNREIRVISEISKGTEEGYLVMIDYEEKLN